MAYWLNGQSNCKLWSLRCCPWMYKVKWGPCLRVVYALTAPFFFFFSFIDRGFLDAS